MKQILIFYVHIAEIHAEYAEWPIIW